MQIDGQTDTSDEDFRNFSNAPKKSKAVSWPKQCFLAVLTAKTWVKGPFQNVTRRTI
jgi:hypothetical protein